MKQEEKQLLLKDLCARLPYGVKANSRDGKKIITITPIGIANFMSGAIDIIKPYLRPMSTMTEEEKQEMKLTLSPKGTAIFDNDGIHIPMTHTGDFVPYDFMQKVLSFLYERHFDVNGLIPLGDAIEVTEENNPYKN